MENSIADSIELNDDAERTAHLKPTDYIYNVSSGIFSCFLYLISAGVAVCDASVSANFTVGAIKNPPNKTFAWLSYLNPLNSHDIYFWTIFTSAFILSLFLYATSIHTLVVSDIPEVFKVITNGKISEVKQYNFGVRLWMFITCVLLVPFCALACTAVAFNLMTHKWGVSCLTILLGIISFIAYLGIFSTAFMNINRRAIDCYRQEKRASRGFVLNFLSLLVNTIKKKKSDWGMPGIVIFIILAAGSSISSFYILYDQIKIFTLGSLSLSAVGATVVTWLAVSIISVFRWRGAELALNYVLVKEHRDKITQGSTLRIGALFFCAIFAVMNGLGLGLGALSSQSLPACLRGVFLYFYIVSLAITSIGVNFDSSVTCLNSIPPCQMGSCTI